MFASRNRFALPLIAACLGAALAALPTRAPACDDPDLLAMDLNDDLLPPPALVASIAADLAVVRAQYPNLADIRCRRFWGFGTLMVAMWPSAFAEFTAGTYTGLDALNAQYGCTGMAVFSQTSRMVTLTFDACYDCAGLAAIYSEHPDLAWAYPRGPFIDGDNIVAESIGTYVFSRGWGDCEAGCIHHHYWRVRVQGGAAMMLDEWGDPLGGSGVTEPPAARIALGQNTPNPFNPRTTIAFTLNAAGPARLSVYDAAGRLVRILVDDALPAGDHDAAWDGRDEAGRGVGSGAYVARLESGGAAAAIRMVLLR